VLVVGIGNTGGEIAIDLTEHGAAETTICVRSPLNVIPREVLGSAVQVTVGARRAALVNKPEAGHFAKAKVEAGRGLWEFRVEDAQLGDFAVGGEVKADIFEVGQIVDVQGVTKGKGFQGTIKRHNFRMGDATHGNSLSHRAPGSLGQRQTPGRVFPGKKMSGHMGAVQQSTQNLEVVKVDVERGLIAVRGAVPGAAGGDVIVRPASKA